MVSGLGGISGLGLVLGVDGGTFVFDISDITVVVVSGVGDGLDTAIGKSDLVRSRHSLAVSGLLGVEVGARVVISNSVLESIGLGGLFVLGLMVGSGLVGGGGSIGGGRGVGWGRGAGGDGHRDSHEGSEDGVAKHN